MYKIDYHIHSYFSPDSKADIDEIFIAAQKAGLDEIIFTDHVECNENGGVPEEHKHSWPQINLEKYVRTLESYKNKYKINFGIGIELGQMTQAVEYAEKTVKYYDWDMILGSLHNLKGELDFYFTDFAANDKNELFRRYFTELYELCEKSYFNVLAHLYYPIRYVYNKGFNIDLTQYNAIIADIFALIIQKNIGLEVNMSGYFSDYNSTIPCFEHLKLYKKLGGELITIGSDAHVAERVGINYEKTVEMLISAGFKAITTYKNQQPKMKSII